jgi:hypothetical protein
MLDPSWDATNGVTSQNCNIRLENQKTIYHQCTDHKLTNWNWHNQKWRKNLEDEHWEST